jgi:hypothetical protein
MTYKDLQSDPNFLLYGCITGSRAYGTDLPTSDTDIRGVFVLPKAEFYGLHYTPQVADNTNDTVYYELGRYVDLLAKNNPNMLELLATPPDCIRYRHPIMDQLTPELFLSKKCKDTFGGYAYSQIKKARGLNKKIVNPLPRERQTPLDFCYVLQGNGSVPLTKWLKDNELDQSRCGLSAIPHFREVYAIHYDATTELGYAGILRKPTSNDLSLSSIPKDAPILAYLHFNKDGYATYCKDHRAYWDWVEQRNEARYQTNLAHGAQYDSKNMMHTFRLLEMGIEILREGVIRVRRPNRSQLLDIRQGKYDYDTLLEMAEGKMEELEGAYEASSLPEEVDLAVVNEHLVKMRGAWYTERSQGRIKNQDQGL